MSLNSDKVGTFILLQYEPYGSDLITFLGDSCASKKQFVHSQILLKASFLVKREPILFLPLLQLVPIHVSPAKSTTSKHDRLNQDNVVVMKLDSDSDSECCVTNPTVMFITAMMGKNSQ